MPKDTKSQCDERNEQEVQHEENLRAKAAAFFLLATFSLAGAAIGGGATTYLGTVAILDWLAGPSESTDAIAMMISVLATGLNFVAFSGTIKLLPLYRTGTAKAIGTFVLCALLALSVSALTSTSIIGMTGTSARAMYLMDEARRLGLQVFDLAERSLSLKGFADFIGPDADASCESAANERTTGQLSGSAGRGVISDSLQTLCTRKTGINQALADNIAASQPLIAEIAELSRDLDMLIIDKSVPIEGREIAFIKAARQLEARMLDLRAADRTNTIRASYEAMQGAIEDLEGLSANVSPGQAVAIAEPGSLAGGGSGAQGQDNLGGDARPVPRHRHLAPRHRYEGRASGADGGTYCQGARPSGDLAEPRAQVWPAQCQL